MNIQELLDERGQVVHKIKALVDKSEENGGVMTAEEETLYNELVAKQDDLKARAERQKKKDDLEKSLEDSINDPHRQNPIITQQDGENYAQKAAVLEAYSRALVHNCKGVTPQKGWEFTAKHAAILKNALTQGVDSEGGYLTPPTEWIDALIKNVDDLVFIRQWATVHRVVGSDSLGVPSLDNDPADADWTSEVGSVNADSTMSFGKRELKPNALSKLLKVSRKLLRNTPNVETLVRERLAYKFGITEEKAYLTGTGASQPLGLFTASADGISTNRDERGSNTTSAIGADTIFDVMYKLKQQYWANARWLWHRDAMKQIAKLKDSQNRYLFMPSMVAGQPDLLAGRPFHMSEYAPNTFAANAYVGLFGDFSHYWIVDNLMMEVQRLDEKYADTREVGFIGDKDTDGMPALEEAFVRVQMAAS